MKTNKHEKIKVIWRFTDGKAGHDKQSLALVDSLMNQTKCRLFDFNVQDQRNPILNIIFKNYKLPEGITKPDIAIGAGHKTHLHLLAIKRCFNSKIVVIMKPSIPLIFFDLCIIPKHDDIKGGANIITTQNSLVNFNSNLNKKENIGLILIGGPSKHFFWDSRLVLQEICKISRKFKFRRLLLTTSRRTPFDFVGELNKLNIYNIKVYEYSQIKGDWLDKHINKVKNIWVTNDSYSMITEALTSGADVDIIDLKAKKDSKLSKEIKIIKNNIKRKIPIQNEVKRVANFILKKWF
ncbi:mitochondrial fission ELM1 family protein [Methylophilales bacterium]|nr:mitochondrial fission ELM1 family protein [Methylophilales bacterium]